MKKANFLSRMGAFFMALVMMLSILSVSVFAAPELEQVSPTLDKDAFRNYVDELDNGSLISYSDCDWDIRNIVFTDHVPSGVATGDVGENVKAWFNEYARTLYIAQDIDATRHDIPVYLPEDSSGLFESFCGLENIQFDYADTSKVTDMSRIFEYCANLGVEDDENEEGKVVDLSSWVVNSDTNMSDIFRYAFRLKKLIVNEGILSNEDAVKSIDNIAVVAVDAVWKNSDDLEVSYSSVADAKDYAASHGGKVALTLADIPLLQNGDLQSWAKSIALYYNDTIEHIVFDGRKSPGAKMYYIGSGVVAWYDDETKTVHIAQHIDIEKDGVLYLDADSSNFFADLPDLKDIQFGDWVDISRVKAMEGIFDSCADLEELVVNDTILSNPDARTSLLTLHPDGWMNQETGKIYKKAADFEGITETVTLVAITPTPVMKFDFDGDDSVNITEVVIAVDIMNDIKSGKTEEEKEFIQYLFDVGYENGEGDGIDITDLIHIVDQMNAVENSYTINIPTSWIKYYTALGW